MKFTKRELSEAMREMGKRGGRARAAKLTEEERANIARSGALAMHRKNGHKIKPKSKP